jgi:putative transcriptional regulator
MNPKRRRVRTNGLGKKLLQSAQQALHAASTGDMTGITIREVEIPEPGQYRPKDVKALRQATGASQRVFAELLGVSKELAAQWEYGIRQPAPVARRLMDKVKENPVGFIDSLVKQRAVPTARSARRTGQAVKTR